MSIQSQNKSQNQSNPIPFNISPIDRYMEMRQLEYIDNPEDIDLSTRMLIQSGIRFYTDNCFSIPSPIVQKYFSNGEYRLVYWSGSYLLTQIEAGYIHQFKVKYHKHLTRGCILQNKAEQYAISFREPNPEWNLRAIVLISGANTSMNNHFHPESSE